MKMIKKTLISAFVLSAISTASIAADYPNKPIQLIVPWSAGGGTDAVARYLATGLEQELGKPINVINRPGGGGVIGHDAIVRAKADGYTIGLATADLVSYSWMGTSPITPADFQAISQVNFDAASINVNAKSDWKTTTEVLKSIEEEPGKYKLSGIPAGAAYHLALAQALQAMEVDPKNVTVVPSQGAAPGFQELAAEGVQIVASAVPEGKSMREAGLIRTLSVLSEERLPGYEDIETFKEATGIDLAAGTWRGVVAPKGIPAESIEILSSAIQKVTSSDQFLDLMQKSGFGVKWSDPNDFSDFMGQQHEVTGQLIKDLGLAK